MFGILTSCLQEMCTKCNHILCKVWSTVRNMYDVDYPKFIIFQRRYIPYEMWTCLKENKGSYYSAGHSKHKNE